MEINERDEDDAVLCFGYQSFTTFPTKKMAAKAWNRRFKIKDA